MNSIKLINFCIFACCMLMLFSCTKNDDILPEFKYEYFPLDSGHAVIYDVDSINIDDNFVPPQIDTFYFQIMEVISDTFIDGEGDVAVEIARFKRDDSTSAWITQRRWSAKKVITRAEKVEEDERYIKLVFPPQIDAAWEGNAYINTSEENRKYLEDWEYTITELDEPKTINGLSFDSTLTVLQHDEGVNPINHVKRIYATEIYAKNVGMIYKEVWNLKAETPLIQYDWDNPIKWTQNGFILRMTISSYSN